MSTTNQSITSAFKPRAISMPISLYLATELPDGSYEKWGVGMTAGSPLEREQVLFGAVRPEQWANFYDLEVA